ncbi:similar to Saccharomyces cerevisiae YOR090C PTC5 Mitochondrial type 2C protein phosphatase (PP2C) [Maudiozyma saulgeensis]|uniref:Similar to Saccharomyces cerevisiae YOR090C PTC5 Mitochondrial type 2C protein phosphatase (PP2C) n=1 Tax=Maudiozyma saulgeensis TaxID=1789683 RepID=A0A1X7R3G1_9SACH|nr:similar to Saccharomyces cerevisiae YOR090C PTC5 Mitochondrial type 2C protein phosphatase (PP2C) [Kazachstania saulgeensis]
MLVSRANRAIARYNRHGEWLSRFVHRPYISNAKQNTSRHHYTTSSHLSKHLFVRSTKFSKDLGWALLGGSGLMLASYSWLTSSPISLDAVDGINHYSTKVSNKSDTITLLTDSEINKKLRGLEQSYIVNRNKGISRYDVAQLPSNNPIEDNHIEQVITVPVKDSEEDLYFFGIFDGHSGPFTSAKLSKDMVRYVAKQLSPFYSSQKSEGSSEQVDSAISNAFIQLDQDIVQESFKQLFKDPSQENMVNVLPAISGSCALLSLYNSKNSTLKVAVTGDSRALIGGLDENNNWFVKALSIDQTGDNLDEVTRIQNEHPGEPNAVRRGRVLGCLQPSRAFGDYRYKLKEVDGKKLSELPDHVKIYFRSEPRDLLTPPYVTSKPEITTTTIRNNVKFMIMGSDGLFELLTNEEIVGLVVKWQEQFMNQNQNDKTNVTRNGKLPSVKDLTSDKSSQRPAFRYKKNNNSNTTDYLLEDSNVATHLIRNALSAGGQKEYVSTLTSIPSPMSRKYRDDLTVTVAFFGESEKKDGSLEINHEATAPPKPKL